MLIMNEQEIEKKQKEHFSVLLNGDDDKKANVNMVGFGKLKRHLV